MKNSFILAAATAVLLAAVNSASAGEAPLSPRAKANQIPTAVSGSPIAEAARGQNALGAAALTKASGRHSALVISSRSAPDVVHEQWARTGSPRGLQQLRESGREFQVAPLK